MDNRYYKYNCPPLMNDGRFLTSYVRSKVFDQYIRNINNIESSQDYKIFLQNNGDQILNNLKSYLRENNTCNIEGKCLPISGPSEQFNLNFLNNNLNKNIDWFNQLTNDSNNVEMNVDIAQAVAKTMFNDKTNTNSGRPSNGFGSGIEKCQNCYKK